jgi:hypothetical protein
MFDKRAYDVEYAKTHIRRAFVPFNDLNPDDVELLEWLEQQGNKAAYIKGLIRADMQGFRCQNGCQTENGTAETVDK